MHALRHLLHPCISTAKLKLRQMQAQRDLVTVGEAEARFAAGEHDVAARLWGRTTGAGPSFEETALRFVDAGATSALQAFLLARLDALGPDDRAQACGDQALRVFVDGARGVCLLAWASWRFDVCGLLFFVAHT